MAILIKDDTRVVVQGLSGRIGQFHAQEMIEYGTKVVAGVTPGKGGSSVLNRPVFNTVREAVEQTGATASLLFVPPAFAADAMMEAAEAGIETAVCVTDGIPAQDMMRVKRFLRRFPRDRKMRLIGPNCAGIISPGQGFMGIMPPHIYMPGRVGIIGRSGTLGYEAASQMQALGIGISSSIGIGGDPINGSSFRDILELFENDPDTDAVMMIGEIGGPQEAEAAEYVRDHMTKPVAAYIAGLAAPKGRKMGHAGAIISAFGESAQEKVDMLSAVGITVAPNPSAMGETVARMLGMKAAA
ncbi:MAG: succinate--CoA ligase subunit alpha [Sagittula sp.]|jgi:malate-CoA ligase subunit alpha|uniref:succinate--CoA ligase subunit alpha n=1 Tax=unclassified Sagittula TaxID=2624628 RepID=UPI000C2D0527|nr:MULTISPECIES: succinate--CoA ligase subunit alpha [unclassified Sagittula]AUC54498.1 succinate--CoA ligase subunit alpha [Sagittula sp. P11]WHZ34160.1 succinate--CoA ligase subunit alpha [Sagittula sp. MA-2]